MFMFIGILGLIGFIIYLVMAIISALRKTGKSKKQMKIAAILFVVFIIGLVASPDTQEQASDKKEASTEVKKEQSKEKKVEIAPSTVAEVTSVIKVGMTVKQYDDVKENKINVEFPETLSIGNGNVGRVLKATDGFVVVGTDGVTILSVKTVATMEEAKTYASRLYNEAKAKKEAEKEKKYQQSKMSVSGTGDNSSEMISLKSGFAIFEGSYSGSGNFIVELMDENGNQAELLVNEIGSYKGKTFAIINSPGNYYLNVKASSSWNYSITQEVPPTMKDIPTVLSGQGDDVVFVNAKSGNYKFTSSHQGQSNFIVMLNGTGLLVNEIGNYSGSTRQKLSTDGYYAIVVRADGKWSIKID
ncbi:MULTISPECIES: hypothetical protein [Bacillus]|uniref:hypothetical protein n=1 Tax=Bacillus TaxID=1386 RepID=UPI0002DB64CD|nr:MULTISPECIES: hypothetical protein [Bacillus]